MFQPPSYCIDAVATDNGWVNPKNGELLVAIKNLSTRIKEQTLVQIVAEPVKEMEQIVDNDVERVILDGAKDHSIDLDETVGIKEEIPSKKRPGRPKKIKQ